MNIGNYSNLVVHMLRLQNFLREVLLFSFILTLLIAPVALQASVEGKLELWFEYAGHQSALTSVPKIECNRQESSATVNCDLYRSEDGRYWIDRPAPGNYLLRVWLQQGDAELYREYPFSVTPSTTGPLLVALNRVLELRLPVESVTARDARETTCRSYSEYEVPLFTLAPSAEVTFAWQALSGSDEYRYKLWRVRCDDDRRIEVTLLGRSRSDEATLRIPANSSGEYYLFELVATKGAQEIGQLLLRDPGGGVYANYPLVVVDPLGERDWYPYVVIVFALPFGLWLAWWLLSGVLMLRSVRGLLWMVTLLIAATIGYTQRHSLSSWSQQGQKWLHEALDDQKWYRDPVDDGEYTASTEITSGSWRGFLVAEGQEPFIGQGRRAEIAISFKDKSAVVSYLHQGQWQMVTGNTFSISHSGAGMTLFGHVRDGLNSELWSITIVDLNAPTLRLMLDRMITRRKSGGGKDVTERRRATGELRHTIP